MILKAKIKVGRLGKETIIIKLYGHKSIINKTMWSYWPRNEHID